MYGFKFSQKGNKFFAVSETNNVNYVCSFGSGMFVRGFNDCISIHIHYLSSVESFQDFKDSVIRLWECENGICN